MTIAVSVQTCWFSAHNNSGGVRQEGTPQSATAYIFGRSNSTQVEPSWLLNWIICNSGDVHLQTLL